MIRKTQQRPHGHGIGLKLLRRQAGKRSDILRKYRDEPVTSTLIKSGERSVRFFRSSDLRRDQKLLMASSKAPKKNWFQNFLDKSRSVLYVPSNEVAKTYLNLLNYMEIKREIEGVL